MCWAPREASGRRPPARYWHTATLVQRKLLVCGGCAPTAPALPCSQPRSAACAWLGPHTPRLRPFPPARHNGAVSLSDLHVLDADAFVWSQPAALGPRPPPLSLHTCCELEGSLVLFGGMSCTSGEALRHASPARRLAVFAGAGAARLTSRSASQQRLPSLPPDPRLPCRAAEGDEGRVSVSYSSDTWTLDCLTLEWARLRQKGAPPQGVAYHAAALTPGGQLLVLGGWRGGQAVGSGELSALDLTTGVWHPLPVSAARARPAGPRLELARATSRPALSASPARAPAPNPSGAWRVPRWHVRPYRFGGRQQGRALRRLGREQADQRGARARHG